MNKALDPFDQFIEPEVSQDVLESARESNGGYLTAIVCGIEYGDHIKYELLKNRFLKNTEEFKKAQQIKKDEYLVLLEEF